LMLWTCELKPNSFLTNDLNLVRVCVELLRTLSVCLTDARCQHYFINSCNLLDNSCGVGMIASQLMSIDEAWLSNWFVKNYIRKCSILCSDSISGLFNDVSTNMKLQNAVSAVINCRLNTDLEDIWAVFLFAESTYMSVVSNFSLTVGSCICWMTELAKIDTRLSVCFRAVAFLHVAHKISRTAGFTDELMDVLATIAGQFISTRRHPSRCSSELSLSKATKLMKVVANSSRSTMQLIEIGLSKAYLYRALKCKDSDSDSVYCLAKHTDSHETTGFFLCKSFISH